MKNPFNPSDSGEFKLKRNQFDLGRNSVFTTEFGQCYPFFLQEVIPGDTARIKASVGVRGMPTLFPVQSKIRISMEFYEIRNRTLMDNWEDFIFKTKDIVAPWLRMDVERAKTMISTGSLGDALGVPSSYARDSSVATSVGYYYGNNVVAFHGSSVVPSNFSEMQNLWHSFVGQDFSLESGPNTNQPFRAYVLNSLDEIPQFSYSDGQFHFSSESFLATPSVVADKTDCFIGIALHGTGNNQVKPYGVVQPCTVSAVEDSAGVYHLVISFSELTNSYLLETIKMALDDQGSYNLVVGSWTGYDPYFLFAIQQTSSSLVPSKFTVVLNPSEIVDATDDTFVASNPFVGVSPRIKLNALPFRAYEQVCNYYMRNDKNNPYMLNGEPQYNDFIPSHGDGADDNVYTFHYKNWELDRFTSAVQSPQFGEAPLVGLEYNVRGQKATLTFEATDSEGQTVNPKAVLGVDDNGNISDIADFSDDLPSANLQRLKELVNYGISINSLRTVNSFQRFLENTLRRGLRYRNQLHSHFGVNVDYPDIDVPQYIGGASSIINTGQVTNMSDTGSVGLGDYVGTLEGGVSLKHEITRYFPEHGYILGIVTISPVPSYPQSVNKSLLKVDPFDYYVPEFGKIGYVPVHYSELMPLQTPEGGSVDDVFGYQRAWYDYMQAFDEVHGDFRMSLKDFVLTRTFKERPELGEQFTVIHPDQLNDIFVANNIATEYGSTARWLCRSEVGCSMARPIPIVGTPSLE